MGLFDRFRRKPAKPDPAKMQRLLADGIKTAFADIGVKAQWSAQLGSDEVTERPGIKPPSDPGADGWTWAAWEKEARALSFPGWSPCRFAHRTGKVGETEAATFVFGIVSGPFGIWCRDYSICSNDGSSWSNSVSPLAVLTHLPTGNGVGIFGKVEHAALAADTARRTCPEFTEYDTLPMGTVTRTLDAWTKLGIQASLNAHAHDISTGDGPLSIMGLATIEDGKPERLS